MSKQNSGLENWKQEKQREAQPRPHVKAMLRRKRAELERDARFQRWKTFTEEERARSVIELMTKNYMLHAKMLGRYESEERLRNVLASIAVRRDILDGNKR